MYEQIFNLTQFNDNFRMGCFYVIFNMNIVIGEVLVT